MENKSNILIKLFLSLTFNIYLIPLSNTLYKKIKIVSKVNYYTSARNYKSETSTLYHWVMFQDNYTVIDRQMKSAELLNVFKKYPFLKTWISLV